MRNYPAFPPSSGTYVQYMHQNERLDTTTSLISVSQYKILHEIIKRKLLAGGTMI